MMAAGTTGRWQSAVFNPGDLGSNKKERCLKEPKKGEESVLGGGRISEARGQKGRGRKQKGAATGTSDAQNRGGTPF